MPPQSTKVDPYAKWKKPDPYAEWKTPDPYAEWKKPEAPAEVEEFAFGKTAEFPVQQAHPELTRADRFKIMWRGGNPEVGQRYLESKGYQVQHKGGFQFALKKGRGDWYFFDEPGASFQDISDVAGDVLSLGGFIGGATIGTIAGAPSGPGAFAGGVAGAGIGSGLAQGFRSATGSLMGVPSRAGEVAGEIGQEAIAGAAGQVVGTVAGKALGAAARGLRGFAGKVRGAPPTPPPAAPTPLRSPALPAKPPPGVEIDQMGWDYLVRNRPETARKAAAAAAKARELPAGKEVSHADMVTALKGLGPRDPAVIEFLRRETSRRTGAEKGTLRTMFFQGLPDVDGEVWKAAKVGARTTMQREASKFGHLTEAQLADLYYRQTVHGLSEKTFDEVIRLTRGMPVAEIDSMISSLSHRFPYNPAEKGLFGPVVDIEARSAQVQGLALQQPGGREFFGQRIHIPINKEVDFWRSIPLEGLRKLQLPDGTILQLSRDQAIAASHVAADIVTRGTAMRKGVARALTRLERVLKTPRRLLYKALRAVGVQSAREFEGGTFWNRPASAIMGAAGIAMGGTVGKALAVTGGMALGGAAIGRLGWMLMADTTGNVLRQLARNASRRLALSIRRVLRLANRPEARTAYRVGVYELLSDPEFQRLAEGQM